MSSQTKNFEDIDIYDFGGRITLLFKKIEKELSQENAELLRKYDMAMVSDSLAKATRLKNLYTAFGLSRILGKNWHDATRQDIDNLVYEIMKRFSTNSGQESNTSFDYKKVLKIFYRWFKLGSRRKINVGDPEETRTIRLKKVKDELARECLVTDSDLTRLLHACGPNQRDRAFIDVHSEAGTRPGEILSVQIKHVRFDKYGAFISVDGKTGPRPIRLVRSVPNLANWLNVHPGRDNPESPLWIMLDTPRYGQPLSYHASRQIIKRRSEMAGLEKKINLKLFRHSEATSSANFLTDAQMRKRHGWTNDSKMPSRYVHLVNSDVDNAVLAHMGIKRENEKPFNLPKKCHFCDLSNSPESKICSKCGRPLDLKTAINVEEKVKNKEIDSLKDTVAKLANLASRQEKKLEEISVYIHGLQIFSNVR